MDSSSGRSDPRPLKVEEEVIKLNTDCIYFLASPLTCKKGSECEYRHSDGARLNPRDCRFWLSGNCLNPKCLFRHPPLDGMVTSPKTISGQIVASSHVSPSVQLPMANSFTYNLGRNNVPCYYYLKGACLKGAKCSFLHGPPIVGIPVAKQNAKASSQMATQSETPEKDSGKIKERNNQQNLPTGLDIANVSAADKLINGSSSSGKGGSGLENAPGSRNGLPRSQTTYDPVRSSSSYSSSHNVHVQAVGEIFEESSGVGYTELERPLNQLQSPSDDHYENAEAAEEIFRDSSPGFDVLVDHGVSDADYFHEKDAFRSWAAIQGRSNVNLGDDYDYDYDYDHYYSDYESSVRLDGFRHDGAGEFLHYGNEQNGDDWNQHMTHFASERIFDIPLFSERNSARRLRSPDEIDASDLRHRLRKRRRQDGYFSATSSVRQSESYNKHDKNMKDRYHAHNSYKDQHLQGSTIGSRLRGRITIPEPPSPEIPSDLQDRRDTGRKRGNHRSLGQRLGWRSINESFANPRYFGRQQNTIDSADFLDFAGPRRLEELKGSKSDRNSRGQSTKYNNHSTSSLKAPRLRGSEASVEFEGPKPLSVLLKRKREAASGNDAIYVVSDDRRAVIPTEEEQTNYEQEDEREVNEEHPEYANQNNGEYYDDTMEGGDYKTEVDYMDHLDADLDAEDDEDDFAKKIGLICS